MSLTKGRGPQISAGFVAFLYPKLSLSQRAEFAGYHRFLGSATYWTGLSAMLVRLTNQSSLNACLKLPPLVLQGSFQGCVQNAPSCIVLLMCAQWVISCERGR